MSISRFFYEPFFYASDFDRLIDDALCTRSQRPSQSSVSKFLKPKMDVHENPEGNTVTASFELPGLKKEDVHIGVEQGRLTVSGESTDSAERAEHGFAIRERRFGQFSRTIQLPEGIKEDEIKANMDNGLLTITFPKTGSEVTPKKITIE